jgi:hypothetical protein
MAMVFPTSPIVGQVFTSGSRSWVWNGSAWDSPSAINVLQVPYGSELISTASFTAQTSVSFDNVFSLKYRFYDYYLTAVGSTGSSLSARLRTGSTDLSTSTYRVQTLISDGTTTTSTTNGTTTQWDLSNTRARMFWKHGTITNPFLEEATGLGYFGTDNISDGQLRLDQGVGNNTTALSYNGIRFFVASGTITGQISIYGRRQ